MAPRKNVDPPVSVALNPIEIQKLVLEKAETILPMFSEMFSAEITSNEDLEYAGACIRELKATYDALETKRKELTQPMLKTKEWIDSLFKPILLDLTKKQTHLKGMIATYTLAQAEIQRKELQAAAAAAREAAESAKSSEEFQEAVAPVQLALQKAQADAVNLPPGVSVGEVWTWELEDAEKVPAEYWSIDPAKLTAAVKAGVREIPGVKVYPKQRVTVRK